MVQGSTEVLDIPRNRAAFDAVGNLQMFIGLYCELPDGDEPIYSTFTTMSRGEVYNPLYGCRNSDVTLAQFHHQLDLIIKLGLFRYVDHLLNIYMNARKRLG